MVLQKALYMRRGCFRMRDQSRMASPFLRFHKAAGKRDYKDDITAGIGQKKHCPAKAKPVPQSFQATQPYKNHKHLQPHAMLRLESKGFYPPSLVALYTAIYPRISRFPKSGETRAQRLEIHHALWCNQTQNHHAKRPF